MCILKIRFFPSITHKKVLKKIYLMHWLMTEPLWSEKLVKASHVSVLTYFDDVFVFFLADLRPRADDRRWQGWEFLQLLQHKISRLLFGHFLAVSFRFCFHVSNLTPRHKCLHVRRTRLSDNLQKNKNFLNVNKNANFENCWGLL